jgi:NAD(P)H-hydrate epimerase
MAEVDKDPNIFSEHGDLSRYTTLGIGPGLGQDARTIKALAKTLEAFRKPVVLDADALNILAANRHLVSLIPPGSILTPHPKEFERLSGPWKHDFERLEIQRQLAVSLKSVVVLKGAHTSIATEKGLVFFNSTGNPGMATGGTGDVLTGIATGLLAQNYTPAEAAIAGVFLHGLAGDLAADECGMDSLTASDLIGHLPDAFLKVYRK